MRRSIEKKRMGFVIGVLLMTVLGAGGAFAQVAVQTPLPGSAIPQFVDPLPIPFIVGAPATGQLVLEMNEFQSEVLSTGTLAPGIAPKTWVWGYQVPDLPGLQVGQTTVTSYIGPVVLATRGTPTEVKFINNLGDTATSNVLAYTRSTDQTLHWADPLNGQANAGNHGVVMGQPPASPWNLNYSGPIPAVPHLHGGEVPPVLDGGPDAWFTSDGAYRGNGYYTKPGALANEAIYRYPNSQESALIWFHDHTLGATRLNVYAGLAGAWLITDATDPANLPPAVPLVIQDRMFDTTGQLYFPAGVPFTPNPEHPFWVPEFVGDTIVVNGKTWPYLNVEPKRYRFLIINGSNARTYELFLVNQATGLNGPAIWQIGTDGGYLDAPAKIDPNAVGLNKLVIMPGERADIIVDFAGLAANTRLLLRNTAKTPYPAGAAPQGQTLGRIMQFRVVPLGAADTSFDPALAGATLRAPMPRLADPVAGTLGLNVVADKTRQLTLNEVMGMPVVVGGVAYPGGPTEILVNNTRWDGMQMDGGMGMVRPDFTQVTIGGITMGVSEVPIEGQTEVWEIVNLTADAHPIHLHLVQFQIMNRQRFDLKKYTAAYDLAFPTQVYQPSYGPPLDYATGNARALGGNPDVVPFLKAAPIPPSANEAGWKDTVLVPPGMVTRIVVRWAPAELAVGLDPLQYAYDFDPNALGQGYVWHCHIIDHEDNEMMRPTAVVPKAGAARYYIQGTDY